MFSPFGHFEKQKEKTTVFVFSAFFFSYVIIIIIYSLYSAKSAASSLMR